MKWIFLVAALASLANAASLSQQEAKPAGVDNSVGDDGASDGHGPDVGGSESIGKGSGAGCSKYTIISTRGTSERPGPVWTFRNMNSRILAELPGGQEYYTNYPASPSQVSEQGTRDIINHIQQQLSTDPSHCFVLQGFSQGAAATTVALSRISGDAFNAVKAVVMFGNPIHSPNSACNKDPNWGTTTASAKGREYDVGVPTGPGGGQPVPQAGADGHGSHGRPSAFSGGHGSFGFPGATGGHFGRPGRPGRVHARTLARRSAGDAGSLEKWCNKAVDVCEVTDYVCNNKAASIAGHGTYGSNTALQDKAAKFVIQKLKSG